jgi:predicted metal-dependent hydrolase
MRELDRLAAGRAAFNRGAYFEAHELWEQAWRDLAGGEKTVVQGLIQIAAGLHHLQRDRPRPAAGLLRKGLDKLTGGGAAAAIGFPVDALARDVASLLAALQTPGAAPPDPGALRL